MSRVSRWMIEHLIPGGKDVLYDEFMDGYNDAQGTGEVVIWNEDKVPALRGKPIKPTDRQGRTQDEVFRVYGWKKVSN